MKYLATLLWSIGMLACQSKNTVATENQTTKADLKTILPGSWEALSFRVQMNTFQNTDSSFILEVKAGEWENKLQMRPIQTEYSADNRYRSYSYNRSDSLIRTERGIWNVFGDTLMLISPEATYQYQVIMKSDILEFKSLLDWDGDGQEDDEYIGIQKRRKQ